jgi:hypothetical protein
MNLADAILNTLNEQRIWELVCPVKAYWDPAMKGFPEFLEAETEERVSIMGRRNV